MVQGSGANREQVINGNVGDRCDDRDDHKDVDECPRAVAGLLIAAQVLRAR